MLKKKILNVFLEISKYFLSDIWAPAHYVHFHNTHAKVSVQYKTLHHYLSHDWL